MRYCGQFSPRFSDTPIIGISAIFPPISALAVGEMDLRFVDPQSWENYFWQPMKKHNLSQCRELTQLLCSFIF
jgi:hypothetical protein